MDKKAKQRIFLLSAILGGVILFLFALAFGLPYLEKRAPLPEGFSEARARAADISKDVVSLSNETNDRVKALSVLDPTKDGVMAASLIADARGKNQEAYLKAVDLSRELEQMSTSFKSIQSTELQGIMYRGIAIEISLVAEFVQYTRDFNEFLESVDAFLSNPSPENKLKVQSGESKVNGRVSTINKLNEEFLKEMENFERAVR